VIFVDTNVFYSVLVKTEFSLTARNIIMMPSKLATSPTVMSELVFISRRKLCKERYGTKNYSEFPVSCTRLPILPHLITILRG